MATWALVPTDNLVTVVCAHADGRQFVVSAVHSRDAKRVLAAKKKKYGAQGERIPWDRVKDNGNLMPEEGPTDQDLWAQAVALRQQGLTYTAIGEQLGVSTYKAGQLVKQGAIAEKVVVPRRQGGKAPADRDNSALAMREKGMVYREIAEQLGYPAPASCRTAVIKAFNARAEAQHFSCKCGTGITSNHYPVECGKCGKVHKAP